MSTWFEEAIPLEKSQIKRILRDTILASDREVSEHFAHLLESFCNDQFQKILTQLYTYYQPFNPNSNSPTSLGEKEELKYVQNLIHHFRRFLEQAQYQPIAEADIRDILKQTKILGIRLVLPPERYKEFLLYYRGRETVVQTYRTWRTLWLKKHSKVITHYKGLNLLFRGFHKSLISEPSEDFFNETANFAMRPQPITIKLFHNIKQHLLPIILPGILIKTAIKTKLYILTLLIFTIIFTTTLGIITSTPWYSLFGVVPLFWFIYEIIQSEQRSKHYHRNLLNQLYQKNVSNNSGVLRYLVDRIAEETYKQNILVLYALWKRQEWSFGAVSLQDLNRYSKKFLLEFFGLNVDIELGSVVARLMASQNENEYPGSIALLENCSNKKEYLKQAILENVAFFDIESNQPLPRLGMVEIAPGTEQSERVSFIRDEFLLMLDKPQGLEFSHSQGAPIRWILENPIKTSLAQDCLPDSNVLIVQQENTDKLPLHGLGRILLEEKNIEFRYHRKRGENRLFLDGGLRYRHTPTPEYPVLVRPIPPKIMLSEQIHSQQLEILIPIDISFPKEGLLKLEYTNYQEILPYQQKDEKTLSLLQAPKNNYPVGSMATLTSPITYSAQGLKKGSFILPVEHTQFFHKRGILIIAPNTELEERIQFRGEIWELSLETPLHTKHRQGSLVFLIETSVKSNLIYDVSSKAKKIYIQGVVDDIALGKIQLDPGENYQEVVNFKVTAKFFDLNVPTQFAHPKNTEVWEAQLESPLRYEAFQGSHLITVENANHFPLTGILEVHYNGSSGVKEVLPFMRTHCSNTLILKTQIRQLLKRNTAITITAVEISAETPYHYHQNSIHADFSCVPDFPHEGQAILEPGSQSEEKIIFKRYPNRVHLQKPLQYYHGQGTLLDFSQYANAILQEDWQKRQERITLEFQHLLPQHGSLILIDPKNPNDTASEVIWYRKKNNRVILNEPCKYHHSQETLIILPTLNKNVRLHDWVEKGMQEIRVINAQELPKQGKIVIEGLFHSETIEFMREDDILFLRYPLQHSFSRFANVSMAEIYLNSHASPGMDYLEVSSASCLPENSELIIDPYCKYEERISFQYRPEILWLYKPLSKNYPQGTIVHSPELLARGAGNLEVLPFHEATEMLHKKVISQYLKPTLVPTGNRTTSQRSDIYNITQNYLKQITDVNIDSAGL